jgi:membrane-associated protease RseP (regulator of RpoE activity)
MKRLNFLILIALGVPAAALSTTPRVDAEMQALLVRLAEAGQLPGPDQSAMTIDQPERVRHELGAVVDVRTPDSAGLPVLAVTPGGAADRLGVLPGDRLLAINGRSFAGSDPVADTFREALSARGGELELELSRGGQRLALSGEADAVVVPAYTLTVAAGAAGGCGRVSVFDVAPRAQHIYPAILIAVDGELPGPTSADVFRLNVGRHTLTVAENIDTKQFGSLQQFQRDRTGRSRYKTFELDVQPNTTYQLGAQYFLDKRNQINDNAYWSPVIYSTRPEGCR